MQKNYNKIFINYIKYVYKQKIYLKKNIISKFLKKLYPICRSITGNGFRDSLKILGEIIDLRIHKFKTGSRVLDWKYLKNGIYLMYVSNSKEKNY